MRSRPLVGYDTAMLDRGVANYPKSVPPDEVIDFLSVPKTAKVQLNLRVTKEAVRILEEEAERIGKGTGKANAFEAMVREIRELRKRKK